MSITEYLPRGWEVKPIGGALHLIAPDRSEAEDLFKGACRSLSRTASEIGAALCITWEGCDRPFQIAPSVHDVESGGIPPMSDLFGADYLKILEFLQAQRHEGNIVIITSNTTNKCLHTNDLLLPSRAHWSAAEFHGYDYLQSWRVDLPNYEKLKGLLERDRTAPGFEYKLRRPDGAICEYETTYHLCRDYCGDEVRIGVSRPQDYRVLAPAPQG